LGRWYVPYRLRKIIKQEKVEVMHMHLTVLNHARYIGKQLDSLRLFFTCHSVPEKVFEGERIAEKRSAQKLIKDYGMH
jgi:hypothetical protein